MCPARFNIGLGGQFAIWAGVVDSMGTPIVIVAESDEKVGEAVMRLARVGHRNGEGISRGGMAAWREAGLEDGARAANHVSTELQQLISSPGADCRYSMCAARRNIESGHVPRALHGAAFKFAARRRNLALDPTKPTAVICAGGYRSSAATSILQQRGFTNLLNVPAAPAPGSRPVIRSRSRSRNQLQNASGSDRMPALD